MVQGPSDHIMENSRKRRVHERILGAWVKQEIAKGVVPSEEFIKESSRLIEFSIDICFSEFKIRGACL